jgi:hypothetical protein
MEGVAGDSYVALWRKWRTMADEDGHYCFAAAL